MKQSFAALGKRVAQLGQVFWADLTHFDLFRHAYSMAYVSLLSLVPSLSAIFAVISLFSPLLDENSNLVGTIKEFILQHLTAGSGEQALGYLEGFIGNLDLKKIGITGFLGTLVTLVLLLKQIEVALNKIFQVAKSRNIVARFVHFWTFSTLGTFILALFIGTLSNFETNDLNQVWNLVSHWANKTLMFVLFTLMYKLIPNCYVKTSMAMIGGLCATMLLSLAGEIFQAYIVLFTNYQAIYGAALAAIPTFLLWLYIIWIIVLLGAVVTWRMQQGVTTTGQPIPVSNFDVFEEAEIRYILPYIVVIKCQKALESGEGTGICLDEIQQDLCIPLHWLTPIVSELVNLGLIIVTGDDEETAKLFATRSESATGMKELRELIHKGGDCPSELDFNKLIKKYA